MISFSLGKSWVFETKAQIRGEKARFVLIYMIGGVGMTSIIYILNEFELHNNICWLIGAIFAVINNFLGSKYYVFKN